MYATQIYFFLFFFKAIDLFSKLSTNNDNKDGKDSETT